MSKYQDPDNTVEILLDIKNSPTIGDVKNLMDKTFPGLFITVLPSFSEDYPHLNDNWLKICKSLNTTPKQIIILDNYNEDSTLIQKFCECFTTAGFCVRKKMEFIPCQNCSKAIPSIPVYDLFKSNNFNIPKTYLSVCQNCN